MREKVRSAAGLPVSSDAIRKHLGGVPLLARGDASLYPTAMTDATYHRLLELGVKLAASGFNVILDAKYARRSLRTVVIELAQAAQIIPMQILYCTAPADVLRDRLQQRTGDIADATVDLLASQQAAWEDFNPAERTAVTTVDTTQDLSELLLQLSAWSDD